MQKRIFLSPPWMSGDELPLIEEAFASNYIAPCGPMVDRFEREFAEAVGLPYACALSSGTAALELLFHELNVVAGDTVFCSDLTFVASIAPAVHRGAVPVFIDCDAATWTMDPALLEEALSEAAKAGRLPKVVVAADLYGQCCDYMRIEAACTRYGVPLIVDAAEALGAKYWGRRGAGDAGMAAVYSFNGNKIITTSGGGMVASRDRELIERARKRSQQSREPVSWYEHAELGYNHRMSNIVAAIGVGQLKHVEKIIQTKRRIFELYRERLGASVGFMPEATYGQCTRWLTVMDTSAFVCPCDCSLVEEEGKGRRKTSGLTNLRTEERSQPSVLVERVRLALEAENIESRPVWKPMHLQPVFSGSKIYGGEVSERLFANGLCLPSGAGLSDVDVGRVSGIVAQLLV